MYHNVGTTFLWTVFSILSILMILFEVTLQKKNIFKKLF